MKVIFVCSEIDNSYDRSIIAYQLIAKVAKKTNASVILVIKNELEQLIAKETLRCYYNVTVCVDPYFKYLDVSVDIQEFLNHNKDVDNIVIIGDNKTKLNSAFSKYFVDSTNFVKEIPWYKRLSLSWRIGLRKKTKEIYEALRVPYKNLMSNQIKGNMRKRF